MNIQRNLKWLTTSAMLLASTSIAGAAMAAPDDGAAIEEVIVTATRREEALKDVPLAVTAITAQEIKNERIFDYKDAIARVPGTSFIPIKGFDLRDAADPRPADDK